MSRTQSFMMGAAGTLSLLVLVVGVAWAADIFTIDQNGSVRLVVTDAGNVGIGANTTPALVTVSGRNYLTIKGASAAGVLELATAQAEADGVVIGVVQTSDPNLPTVDKRYANIGMLMEGTSGGNRGGKLLFATKTDGGILHNSMAIDNAGKVGIGTITPKSTLHVIGLSEYVDNAAAIAAGLTAGAFYRTGDILKIVH